MPNTEKLEMGSAAYILGFGKSFINSTQIPLWKQIIHGM